MSTYEYNEEDIQVFEGIDAVRCRPARYLGGRGPNALLQELLCNALDEAICGHASSIEIELFGEGGVRVRDDGRGIPVALHKSSGQSVLEIILTSLHAGCGGFRASSYVAREVCDIGLTAVNYLSRWFRVDVWRDGYHWVIEFERGVLTRPLERLAETDRCGTLIQMIPDEAFFKTPIAYDFGALREWFNGLDADFPEGIVTLPA